MAGSGIEEAQSLLANLLADAGQGEWFACTREEGEKAFLHRFVAGGAAIRFKAVHGDEVEGVISLDFAFASQRTRLGRTLAP